MQITAPYQLLAAAAVLLCLAGCESEQEISHDEYGDQWPFTVASGTLRCEQDTMIVFTPHDGPYEGVTFAVNGSAKPQYRDVDPIWRSDDTLKDELMKAGATSDSVSMLKIPIGEIITQGLELC